MKLSQIILKEEKNCGCGQTPCITYGVNEEKGVSREILLKLVNNIGPDRFAEIITDLRDENLQDQIVAAFKMYKKDGSSFINPDVLKEKK